MNRKPLDVIKSVDASMMMLRRATIDFIEENQSDKGFINTESDSNGRDIIWAILIGSSGYLSEMQIKAVKVDHGNIMILVDDDRVVYSDDSIREADDDEWYLLSGDDYMYQYPTLYNLAYSIDQFV